jgi:hypothetical protein
MGMVAPPRNEEKHLQRQNEQVVTRQREWGSGFQHKKPFSHHDSEMSRADLGCVERVSCSTKTMRPAMQPTISRVGWKLEAALKCRSGKKGRYAPPVHMVKLTQEREITPYAWVHPDEER